jgi:glycosyltransferase involved in cell wall biosynthesis
MATALRADGHRIHVVTYPFGEDLPVPGVAIERAWYWKKSGKLQSGPVFEKFLLDLFLLFTLIRVIRREKIDLIHAHGYEAVLLGAVAKLLTGKPLIYHAHNLMSDELPAYKFFPHLIAISLGRVLDWMVPRFPDHVIALTVRLKNAVIAENIPEQCVDVIPVSIDAEMFTNGDARALRSAYSLDSQPVVMYTGICSPLQRLDILLRAFVLVAAAQPNARLMIVTPLSKDPDLEDFQRMADDLNVGARVVWVRGHRLQELRDYLALASVTVISRPYIPGQPVKLLNAMSASRPAVCFAGAAEGMLHLRDAYIVPGDDWRELAAGIIALLDDPKLAAEIGAAARESLVRNFSNATLARRIAGVYERVIRRAGSPRAFEPLHSAKPVAIEPDVANG